MQRRTPGPTLFPYTTLFRSVLRRAHQALPSRLGAVHQRPRPARVLVEPHGVVTAVAPRALRQIDPLPRGMLLEGSEEHTSELQSRRDIVCRLLLEEIKAGQN